MDKKSISFRLYSFIYKLLAALKLGLYIVKGFLTTRRFKNIALMLIGILCIVASLIFIYIGIKEGEFNSSYKEVFIVELGFVGIILAIFFTLVTIPIQNVISKYSTSFFKRVSRNRTYIFSFIILALILLYNLIVLIFGGNQFFAYATGFLGFLTMIILGALILETFHLLDVRNLISLIADDCIKEMRKNFKIYKFMNAPFEVDVGLIDKLKNSIDPIISATNRAIFEDQLEIARSGYSNFVRVTREYLESRKYFGTYSDKFLYYVNDHLIDQLKISEKYSHRYVSLIVDSTLEIAEACLVAKPIRSNFGENNLVNPFMTMLKRIALGPEILKETSYAPSSAITHLMTLGIKLVKSGFSTTAVLTGEFLGEISRKLVKSNNYFHDELSRKANIALMNIMMVGFTSIGKIINKEYYFKLIRGQIWQFFIEYLPLRKSYIMKGVAASPYYNPFLQTYTFSKLYLIAISIIYQDNRDLKYAEREIEEIIKLIEMIGDLAIKNKEYQEFLEINTQLYRIFIINIIYILREDVDENLKRFYLKIIDMALEIQFGFLSKIVGKSANGILDDFLDEIYSILGIAFYYKYKEERSEFDELIEKITKKAIDIISKTSQLIKSGHDGQMICKYLRLSGSWYMRFDRSSAWTETIAKKVAEIWKVHKYPNFLSPEEINYPIKHHREWYLERVEQISPSVWNELDKFFHDEESKEQFDGLVESFREEKL